MAICNNRSGPEERVAGLVSAARGPIPVGPPRSPRREDGPEV